MSPQLLAPLALLALGSAQEAEPSFGARVDTLVAELDGGAGGLAVDSAGFVYCADFGSSLGAGSSGGHRVWRVDPETGETTVFATGLRGASGNAFGPGGDLFQSNIGTHSVARIDGDGAVTEFLAEQLRSPVGIAIDSEGTLFVANCGAASIVEVTPDGEAHVFASSPLLNCPNGLALDGEHNLYVSNFNNGDVLRVTPLGEVSRLATLPGNNNGHLTFHGGSLYVAARGAHQIFKVSLAGEVELFAGSGQRGMHDGPAVEAEFSFPNDLAFSPDGSTLYVNENASTTEAGGVLAPLRIRRIRLGD